MNTRGNTLLWTSALVAPSLAIALALAPASAQVLDIERSGQDNVSFVGATDSEVERLIRQFGPSGSWNGDRDGDEGVAPNSQDDGIPAHLHRAADAIGRAYETGNFSTVFEELAKTPDVRAARPEVNLLEAWSYHNSGQPRKALDLFMDLYKKEPSPAHAAGVIYSGMRSAYYTRTYEFAAEQGGPLATILKPGEPVGNGKPQNQIEKTHLDFLKGWLDAAVRYGRLETAERVAKLLGLENAGETRAALALSYGWRAHKGDDFEKAITYFKQIAKLQVGVDQTFEALFGYALSLKDANRPGEARSLLAAALKLDDRTGALKAGLDLQFGYEHFEAGHYAKSLGVALDVQKTGFDQRSAHLLEAWSLFHLGEIEPAASIFADAYRAAPDKESADGIVASLMALGRRDELVTLSASHPGPLVVPPLAEQGDAAGPWVMSKEDRAFYRGDFAIAARTNAEIEETLTPWLGLTFNYKRRDGDKGLGDLEMIGDKLSFKLTDGLRHVRAEIEVLHLDAGGAPKDASLTGSRALVAPRPFSPTTKDTVFQPSFHFVKEGDWGLEGSLGTTPLEGQVHPTITGRFDVVHHQDGARYSAGVYRNSIYESILSITGMKDTVTGQSYGRVVETGLHGSVYQPVAGNWSLNGEARWGERTGENVDTNQTQFFNIGAVYSFDVEGFSYLALGPSFRSVKFDKNRSFFTFGHGGYYSPAELNNVSLNLHFQTEEKKDWIVRGSASLGYEEAETDAATYYPLTPLAGDPFYAGQSSEGFATSFEAVASRRLSDNIIGEAGIYGINTEDYSEGGIFLKLRATFGKRDKVYRSDLTEDLHRKYH
jgi:tetratricopeptide (TPR) repeat protein